MKNLIYVRLSTFVKSVLICLLLFFATRTNALAQNSFNSKFEKIVFGCYASDIKEFEEFSKTGKTIRRDPHKSFK